MLKKISKDEMHDLTDVIQKKTDSFINDIDKKISENFLIKKLNAFNPQFQAKKLTPTPKDFKIGGHKTNAEKKLEDLL